jgi:hypothetical protein
MHGLNIHTISVSTTVLSSGQCSMPFAEHPLCICLQVLVGWLLPGLRYQYTQNGPRRRGPGMAAKCLEPPKDIGELACSMRLTPCHMKAPS